jgi:hypothetical protein
LTFTRRPRQRLDCRRSVLPVTSSLSASTETSSTRLGYLLSVTIPARIPLRIGRRRISFATHIGSGEDLFQGHHLRSLSRGLRATRARRCLGLPSPSRPPHGSAAKLALTQARRPHPTRADSSAFASARQHDRERASSRNVRMVSSATASGCVPVRSGHRRTRPR